MKQISNSEPKNMEKYPVLFFLLRYVLASGLLYYNIKKNKGDTLMQVFALSFAGIGIIVLLNYLLSLSHQVDHPGSFYDINFVDFVVVTLLINTFIKQRKKPAAL